MASMKYTTYTKNMYLGNKNTIWSKINRKRLGIIKREFQKIITSKSKVLEIGSYDLYTFNYILNEKCVDLYHGLDIYSKNKKGELTDSHGLRNSEIYNIATNNLQFFKTIRSKCILDSTAEAYLHKNFYDVIVSFETIEHVKNEELVLYNISQNLKQGGFLIFSVPLEKYLSLVYKEIFRKLILGHTQENSIKDIFYGFFGKTSKITRKIGRHRGYDHARTDVFLKKMGFKKITIKSYPFGLSFIDWGVVCVYQKK